MEGESCCCPPNSLPALTLDSEREHAGTEHTLGSGLKVYVVEPKTEEPPKKAVIAIYDVYGFKGGRIKGVCDSLGEEGYLVALPDIYGNEAGVQDYGGFATAEGKKFLLQFTWEDVSAKLDEVLEFLKGKG
eukprot:CAMPEP_0174271766 /NCGR_PEP_ID=MMETSP0439-20130205/49002_1 /TAXON_ID=0 /ORGANISM="Stereomyxa ramosa, Strain Chinc5" /LENGTH=130 /DNA_ID=CAMNT_0015361969 /DNA_START=31 /DNA_END=420 /DNA_ORIENTATION=+